MQVLRSVSEFSSILLRILLLVASRRDGDRFDAETLEEIVRRGRRRLLRLVQRGAPDAPRRQHWSGEARAGEARIGPPELLRLR